MDNFDDYFGFEDGKIVEEPAENNQEKDGEDDVKAQDDEDNKEIGLADVATAKTKTRKSGVRALLNVDKLCSEKGISDLRNLFDGVKFKGRGHEIEDLNTMMAKLEYWAHRLCPKMPFDDILEKIEDLGSKRPVQVALSKMRYGDIEPTPITAETVDAENDNMGNVDIVEKSADKSINVFGHESSQPVEKVELNDEQRRRIEENKRRAQERRLAKVVQPVDDDFDAFLGSLGADFDKRTDVAINSAVPKNYATPASRSDDIDFMEQDDFDDEPWPSP